MKQVTRPKRYIAATPSWTAECSKRRRLSSINLRTAQGQHKVRPLWQRDDRPALQKVPTFQYLLAPRESGGMADALDLGSSAVRRGGSSPPSRTNPENTGRRITWLNTSKSNKQSR